MDSNKRSFNALSAGASASASPDPDERANKRRRLPSIDPTNETAESTTQYGLVFLEQLRNARDRRGRLIATHFIDLPDKNEYPDYYEAIVMPLSIESMKEKLNRGLYPNLTTVESDVKRMVTNAKAYNEKGSDIWTDAEKIRKQSVEFMKAYNPAYGNPHYVPFPTPLPGEAPRSRQSSLHLDRKPSTGRASVPRQSASTPQPESTSRGSVHGTPQPSATPAIPVPDPYDPDPGFAGRAFQQAQEIIVSKVMNLQDEAGNQVVQPFMTLPSKKLKDYYSLIKRPVSLRSIWKKVRGVHGRNGTSGVSDFSSWAGLEEEMSLIWHNAREYNEDGSDIVRLAGVIEAYFYKIFAEAKEAVSEPAQVNGDSSGTKRLKLKMSNNRSSDGPAQKIKLRMKNTASKIHFTSAATASNDGVAIDKDALQRQQQHVQAGINGRSDINNQTNNNSVTASISGSGHSQVANNPATSITQGGASLGQETSTRKPSSVVVTPLPAPSAFAEHRRALDAALMPPPPKRSLTPNGVNGTGPHPPNSGAQVRQQPATPYDSRERAPGKDASDALITNVNISTHPGLTLESHFRLDVPASDTATQHSVTMHLPASHYYLNIVPTLASGLATRPHVLVVTTAYGTQKIQALPHSDPRAPVYEIRLMAGVNRIDVEIVAALIPAPTPASSSASPQAGNTKVSSVPQDKDIDYERFTLFVNLMKN
ncbi:MAG: hypothetical protein M1816_008233 [Peltula sp. TS41687]|nr:MAG: hypothetical protein M1816_008233 [Peltula sp. TS41687]